LPFLPDQRRIGVDPVEAEVILTARRFRIERRVYRDRDGAPFTWEVVVHPGAVLVLPVLDDGRIVMIRQVRRAVDEELWELPAGTREPDEPPEVTAGRELIEETGYRASRIEPLIAFYTSPGVMTELMHTYVATGLEHVGQRLEPAERIETEVLSPQTVHNMLVSGRIRDGKTIAALAAYLLRNGAAGPYEVNTRPPGGMGPF